MDNNSSYNKEWYEKNKEMIAEKNKLNKELKKEYDKEYREKNKDKLNEYYNSEEYKKHKKEYYLINKEIIIKKKKEYREKNKEKRNKRQKERIKNDPLFRLTRNIRKSISKSLKNNGYTKKSQTYKILECSYDELKTHLQKQFSEWMNWENYGLYNGELNYGWDIDHIIPLSSATNEEELLKLNHFTNLQPLCSKYNRDIKRNNY